MSIEKEPFDLQIKTSNDGNYIVTSTTGDTFITSTTSATSTTTVGTTLPLTSSGLNGNYTIPSNTGVWTITYPSYPTYPDPQVLDDLIKKVKELEEELKCMKLRMILEEKSEEEQKKEIESEDGIKEKVNG